MKYIEHQKVVLCTASRASRSSGPRGHPLVTACESNETKPNTQLPSARFQTVLSHNRGKDCDIAVSAHPSLSRFSPDLPSQHPARSRGACRRTPCAAQHIVCHGSQAGLRSPANCINKPSPTPGSLNPKPIMSYGQNSEYPP